MNKFKIGDTVRLRPELDGFSHGAYCKRENKHELELKVAQAYEDKASVYVKDKTLGKVQVIKEGDVELVHNMNNDYAKKINLDRERAKAISDDLRAAFRWYKTNEGADYWSEVCNKLEDLADIPEEPELTEEDGLVPFTEIEVGELFRLKSSNCVCVKLAKNENGRHYMLRPDGTVPSYPFPDNAKVYRESVLEKVRNQRNG